MKQIFRKMNNEKIDQECQRKNCHKMRQEKQEQMIERSARIDKSTD